MSEIPLTEDEKRAVDRLRDLGGRANIFSFPDLDVVNRLITRGVFREFALFGVEFASPAPAVQKTDAPPEPAKAMSGSGPKRQHSWCKRKPQFSRLEPVGDRKNAIAGRIFDFLGWALPQTKRDIERTLHSYRYPDWKDAWAYLLAEEAITVEDGIVKIIDPFADQRLGLPCPHRIPPEPNKKRRKRLQSEWFKEVYRRSEEEGVAISDILEEDRLKRRG
jgi:hypothetical protein